MHGSPTRIPGYHGDITSKATAELLIDSNGNIPRQERCETTFPADNIAAECCCHGTIPNIRSVEPYPRFTVCVGPS